MADREPLLSKGSASLPGQAAPALRPRVGGLGPDGYGATLAAPEIFNGMDTLPDARCVHVPTVDTEQTIVWRVNN